MELIQKHQIYPLKVGYDCYTAQHLVQDMEIFGFYMGDVYRGYNLMPVINEVTESVDAATVQAIHPTNSTTAGNT